MNYKNTLALLPAAILAACGGDRQEINEPRTPGSVVYSYPADGQRGVSPKADLVLRFSHDLSDENAASKIRVTDGESSVPFTAESVDGDRSLKLSPQGELNPGTEYTIEFTEGLLAGNNRIIETPNAVGAEGVQFSTRGAFSGIAGLDNLSDSFTVDEMIPAPDGVFRPMSFSSFRLRLTQPVHPEWQAQGGVIEITDSNGDPVPATVLTKGRLVTIDPCVPNEPTQCGREEDILTPGETYTVSIRNLPGLNGGTLENFSQELIPRDTSPTVVLFQEVIDSGLNAGTEPRRSKLNGQIINGVTLNSVLQGVAGPSQQTGGLFAELAFAPAFEADEPLPLRVPRGSVLSSSSLDVRVNGLVPIIDPATGEIQRTGNIKVTMLSDATGYLMPNPYTDDLSAPRHVKLFMDVAMNTEAAQPNAALSQDLLGVELSGIAIVEDGTLTIDAIGMVEPNLLGQEFTEATIAFRIEATTDSTSQLDAAAQRDGELEDLTGPELVSWMPGPEDALPATRQNMQRPGDPVVLNFDEPLDPGSVEGGITLSTSEGDVANLNTKVDGTVLVLNPVGGLKHGVDYTVNINGVTDMAGNPANVQALTFSLPESDTTPVSPIALTTYPGYPCVTTPIDLSQDTHGECINSEDAPAETGNDILPITTLPTDRPIVVVFSQPMDLESIRLGETFRVETVAEDGSVGEPVAGRLEKNVNRIRFYPQTPWHAGQAYRYVLASDEVMDCTSAICSANGAPLQTDALRGATDIGGPDMEIYFRGTESIKTVYTPLRNLPARDVNANFAIEASEPGAFPEEPATDGGFKPSSNTTKLATNGAPYILTGEGESNVGCEVGLTCPESKFIYQTGGLNTEVVGPVDPDDPSKGVRVLLYPTLLVTTSIDVYLDGDPAADLILPPEEPQITGPQMLRMRYADLDGDGNRTDPIPGKIIETDNGPVFKTSADLLLDAPDLALPMDGLLAHNLFSYELTLELEGPITFFDDGRMQIEQYNTNEPALDVAVVITDPALSGTVEVVSCLLDPIACITDDSADDDEGAVRIPLKIPRNGVYLNFLSNPIKEIPDEY